MVNDESSTVIDGNSEQLNERQKLQLAKLSELRIQIGKLEKVEAKTIGEAGLQDDIKNRLHDLQLMKVLSVEERNAFDRKIREILSAKLK